MPIHEIANAREAQKLSGVAAHPVVRKVMERFPGAKIVELRGPEAPPAPIAAEPEDDDSDFAYVDSVPLDEDF